MRPGARGARPPARRCRRGGLRLRGVLRGDRLEEERRVAPPVAGRPAFGRARQGAVGLRSRGGVVAGLLRVDRLEQAAVGLARLGRVARHRRLRGRDGDRVDRGRGGGGRGGGRCGGGRAGGGVVEPPAARELGLVVGLVEARDLHDVAGVGRVEELVAAHRDADVVHVAARVAEEHEVAREQLRARHRRAVRRQRSGRRSRAGSSPRPARTPTARDRSSRSRSPASSRPTGTACR